MRIQFFSEILIHQSADWEIIDHPNSVINLGLRRIIKPDLKFANTLERKKKCSKNSYSYTVQGDENYCGTSSSPPSIHFSQPEPGHWINAYSPWNRTKTSTRKNTSQLTMMTSLPRRPDCLKREAQIRASPCVARYTYQASLKTCSQCQGVSQ